MKPRPNKAANHFNPSFTQRRSRSGADLHVHTTHSDGVCSPCEVVVAAARVGLTALAITDHDTVSAVAVARPEAARWGLELIAGVELTCVCNDSDLQDADGASLTGESDERELHILGYFIRDDDPALVEAMALLRAGRVRRVEAMAARLAASGLSIDLDAVRQAFPRATLGRPHLADYLTRTGQATSRREAFARYLGDGRMACVAKPRLDAHQAIALIQGAGGVAALAHPPHDLPQDLLEALVAAGLRAIEIDGPGFSNGKSRRIRAWADQLGLVGIAGSDFHAPDRPGRWVGAITTSRDDLERLRAITRPDLGVCRRLNPPSVSSNKTVE